MNIYLCIYHMEMLETKQALRPLLNKPQLPEGLFFALKNASV